MNTTELRNFLSRIENLNKAKTWLKAKRLETNSTVTKKDFVEVKFKLAKEKVTEVIKEVDENFDAHFQEPTKVKIVYNNKLKELKEGQDFTEEERKMIGSKIKYIENHIEKRLLELNVEREESQTPQECIKKNIHPVYNPNLWNFSAYELFKYLFDNYYKGKKKRELTNIWFFLNEYNPEVYVLKATKDEYKAFVKQSYQVELKNFDKAIDKYQLKEFPTMRDHRNDFEDLINSKNLKNT